MFLFRLINETEAAKKNTVANVGHNSRANASNSNNQDNVFIPPKTPVRSKTRDTQYNTPMKMVSKSGMLLALDVCFNRIGIKM